jgi:DNA ligase D-like protein (predicted 3'-phosphoesterase)
VAAWTVAGGDPLSEYRAKRDFTRTAEPSGAGTPDPTAPTDALPDGVETGAFVVQQHDATRMHYDFRLEVGGVLKSWAVPRGPSLDPGQKRLAVPTEDHPLEYRHYEGTIPRGSYGAGPTLIWDHGTYVNVSHHQGRLMDMESALTKGHVSVWLRGEKLSGAWSLTRMEHTRDGKEAWLLVKQKDGGAEPGSDVTMDKPRSVVSGLTISEMKEHPPA